MGLLKSVAKKAALAAAVLVGKRIASSLALKLKGKLAKPPQK